MLDRAIQGLWFKKRLQLLGITDKGDYLITKLFVQRANLFDKFRFEFRCTNRRGVSIESHILPHSEMLFVADIGVGRLVVVTIVSTELL